MSKHHYDNNIIEWINKRIIGKEIVNILFSGDDPFLDKNSMKALLVNHTDKKRRWPAVIHEQDVPDEWTISRGRATYGCKVTLLFDDSSTVTMALDDDNISLNDDEQLNLPVQKEHNINERQLFEPIIGGIVAVIKIYYTEGNPEKGVHAIELLLDNGLILDVSTVGAYILIDEGVPMQISISEFKTMIPNYGDLFDLPLIKQPSSFDVSINRNTNQELE